MHLDKVLLKNAAFLMHVTCIVKFYLVLHAEGCLAKVMY